MTQDPGNLLNLPRQDFDQHSAFALEASAVRRWLAELPRANTGHTTRALYEALQELNRVRLTPGRRLELMQALQPSIDLVRQGLQRHYLNQPILLPEQPRRVAQLALAINRVTTAGYGLAALQAAQASPRSSPQRSVVAQAVGQALEACLQQLLLHYQLYQPAAGGLWRTIHTLYRLALSSGTEQHGQAGPPGSAYVRCLLLAGATPNQLRQRDLEHLHRRLATWPQRVQLVPGAPPVCTLIVDPASDDGPVQRGKVDAPGHHWLGLNLHALVVHLEQTLEEPTPDAERELLMRLLHQWSRTPARAALRTPSHERLCVALGLSATHHFVSDEEDFQQFIYNDSAPVRTAEQANPFLKNTTPRSRKRGRDVWDRPYQDGYGQARISVETIEYDIRQHREPQPRAAERVLSHPVHAVDASPRGYCLQWPADTTATLRAGELIGLRAADAVQWMIARICWVQSLPEGPRIGAELMSPGALPFAARVEQHGKPQGEYQRVLVLPEVKAIRQTTTLVTPRLPFREQHRVLLVQYGEETRVQLTRQVTSTGAFSQFEFKRLSHDRRTQEAGSDNGGFDSLWDRL